MCVGVGNSQWDSCSQMTDYRVEPSPSPMWAPGIKLDGKYLYMLSHFAGPDAVFKNKYFFFILSWLVVPSCLDYT